MKNYPYNLLYRYDIAVNDLLKILKFGDSQPEDLIEVKVVLV